MILIIRASHANEFELQNYSPLSATLDIRVVTSHHPLTPTTLPTIPLWSPTDLPHFPLRHPLLNRLIGGEQWLLGLANLATPQATFHTAETYTPYTHQAVELRCSGKIAKLICTCWETIPHANEKLPRLKEWKKQAYQIVDLFHTPTKLAKQALVEEGVPPNKIRVIPYGVDLSRFHPSAKRFKSHTPVILTVGRPVKEKGYKIWQTISHELSGLAEFRWVTGQDYRDMPSVYQQADIFLLPSLITPTWEEQYGMVLIEAMASGLPIVSTSSGAIPEVLGKAGVITTHDLLVLTLRKLLSDPPKLAQLSRASLARARLNYSHFVVAQHLSSLYN